MRTSPVLRLKTVMLSSLLMACADDGGTGAAMGPLTNSPTGSTTPGASTSAPTTGTPPATTTPTTTTVVPTTTTPATTTVVPTTTTPMATTVVPTTTTPMTTTDPTNTTPQGTGGSDPVGGGGSGGMSTPEGTGGTPEGTGGMSTPENMGGAAGSDPGPGPGPAGSEGPCDIYEEAGTPCVAAYSMVRRLLSTYDGPLYQVRSGSSEYNIGGNRVTNPQQAIHPTNGGTVVPYTTSPEPGELHDIPQTADGFGDAAAQDAACEGSTCTVVTIYDQSGRGNHISVAKGGRKDGGDYAALDNFETIADFGAMSVGGRDVYSLFMEARQGYRQTSPGEGMPRDQEPQGMYMLADGTNYGVACCWDFGNVTPDPTQYHTMNTLFLGVAYWGKGAGNGPWFMADYEAGVWAGGSNPGDPGWGALSEPAPANENNPSMQVPFALGFLKTGTDYALRMANLETATELITAYEGPLPKPMDNQGAVVLGVGGDNSNNSWGTFFEGAIVAGYPTDDAELRVMQNIQAVGYGQ